MNDSNSTILLVDGDSARVELLERFLDGTGYILETVADAVQGWKLLEAESGRFDAVMLDAAASGSDGALFIERVRQHPVLQLVPLILQTGPQGADPDPYGEAELHCLEKPFNQAQLLDALAAALRERVICRRFRADSDERGMNLGSMREATFTFKTIHSARDLANLLARTFPEPRRAVVGLTELLLNAVEHGNLCISYAEKQRLRCEGLWEQEVATRVADPDNADKEVWVEYARDPRLIRVLIRDQGNGFDWRRHLDIDPARVADLHGRGIAMARMISFDRLEYRGNGNEVEVAVGIPAR